MTRRWHSPDSGGPVTNVPPGKKVEPEILLGPSQVAVPKQVAVVRQFDGLLGRILMKRARPSARVITLGSQGPIGASDSVAVRYEAWPAALLEPRERPTTYRFRGFHGDRRGFSDPLYVSEGVHIAATTTGAGSAQANVPGVPLGGSVSVGRDRTLIAEVSAPVDPRIEFFTVMPGKASPSGKELSGYIEDEFDALAEVVSDHVIDIAREDYLALYASHLEGTGLFEAEFERKSMHLEEGENAKVSVDLHPHGEGVSMIALGARFTAPDGKSHEAVSDLIPLRWPALVFDY